LETELARGTAEGGNTVVEGRAGRTTGDYGKKGPLSAAWVDGRVHELG